MGISSPLLVSRLLRPPQLGGPPLAANWTPASLGAALKFWVKADTGITLNGSDVSSWADQSGNGADISQGTAAKQPLYDATGFNSLPTVKFTAANSDGLLSGAAAVSLGNATLSVFVVGQLLTGTSAYGRAASFIKNGGVDDYDAAGSGSLLGRDASSNGFRGDCFSTNVYTQAISLATNYRLGAIWDGSAVTPYVNNVAGTTGPGFTTAFAATGKLAIGTDARDALGAYWDGPISEVVITNTALDATERLNLDNYFKAKWGL